MFGFCMEKSSGCLSEALALSEQGWSFPLVPHTTSFPLSAGGSAHASCHFVGLVAGELLLSLLKEEGRGLEVHHGLLSLEAGCWELDFLVASSEGCSRKKAVANRAVFHGRRWSGCREVTAEKLQLCSHSNPSAKNVFWELSSFLKAWLQRLPVSEGWCFLSPGLWVTVASWCGNGRQE